MASPPPKSPEQTEKSKKYDRQLRLWGDHGQNALENANICLINVTGIGTEVLKSLVLPGIGGFTIVDDKTTTEDDLGSNFFLDPESVGKPRAQAVAQFILELNSDVKGDFVEENVDHLLENSPEFFNSFAVVIGTSLPEKSLISLSKKLWDLEIPLIICKSYGFVGMIRVQVPEHTVIETHPDNRIPDLRLDKPFPELVNHLESYDITSMNKKDYSHVPYLVLLYKFLKEYKNLHDKLPQTFKEKQVLRKMIKEGIRKDIEQYNELENFEEAIKAVNTSIITSTIHSNIKDILNDDRSINLTDKSKPFWIMARSVKEFVDIEGVLPLRGAVPDMTADTDKYIGLQQLFHNQASKDAETVYRRVQQLLHQLNQPSETISESDVKLFCKHTDSLHLVRGTCIADEYNGKFSPSQNMVMNLENPENNLVYYVMLRGIDRFYSEYNTYPGEFDDQVEPDIVKLKACISKLLNEWGCGPLNKDDYLHEVSRFGGAELHSVSAFIGGCVAQEAIKFITCQYKLINNTLIYDAITSTTSTYIF